MKKRYNLDNSAFYEGAPPANLFKYGNGNSTKENGGGESRGAKSGGGNLCIGRKQDGARCGINVGGKGAEGRERGGRETEGTLQISEYLDKFKIH